MKTAIYIEDGVVQLVITPESKFEKDAIKSFSEKSLKARVFSGSFYSCRGGWVRNGLPDLSGMATTVSNGDDSSLILRMSDEPEAAPD